MPQLLLLSNGHGEDVIGAALARRLLAAGLSLEAWPMVGEGEAYRRIGVGTRGPTNRLPSGGVLLGARRLLADLRAGFLSTYGAQLGHAVTRQGHAAAIAIGDVVPLAAALLTGAPTLFVGSVKTERHAWPYRYGTLELRLMRRCRSVIARDEVTAAALEAEGVPVETSANGLLDAFLDEPCPPLATLPPLDTPVLLFLPGSRSDAAERITEMLRIWELAGAPGAAFFAMAATVPPSAVREGAANAAWSVAAASGGELVASDRQGRTVRFLWNAFGALARRATMAIGSLASAAQQVAAQGVPIVTYHGESLHRRRFATMEAPLFGASCVVVTGGLPDVGAAIVSLLADPVRRARMGSVGRERMGRPGLGEAVLHGLGTPGLPRQPWLPPRSKNAVAA